MTSRTPSQKSLALSLILFCLAQPVLADQTWKGTTDNQWTTPGNWSGGALPGLTDLVIYNNTSTANLSNWLSQGFSIKGILFSNVPGSVSINSGNVLTNGASGINMTNVTQNLAITASLALGANQSWIVATNQSLTVSGTLSGTGGLYKDAFGTLFLTGTNTFTGNLTNNGGQIWINNSSALGVGPKTITIANNNVGAGLHLNPASGNISLANNISWIVSDALGAIVNEAGSNTISGPMSVFSGGGAPYFVANAGTLVLNGAITLGTTARPMTLGGSAAGIDSAGIGSAGLAVQKVDSGTWTLTTNNTYGGATTISGGTLALGPGGAITNTPSITISANATLDVSAVTNASGPNAFALSAGLTNQTLAGSGTVAGNVANVNGTAIQPGGQFTVGTLTFANNLKLNSNATNYFDLNTATTPGSGINDLLSIGGNLDPNGASIFITALSSLTAGSYRLANYSESYLSSFNPSILTDTRYTFSLDDTSTPGQINVNVSGSSANLVWGGNYNPFWDLNGTPNWNSGTLTYLNADSVTFDDTGAGPLVTLDGSLGALRPISVIVNANNNYSFSAVNGGKITGLTGITKSGSGVLTNAVTGCDFIGPIIVNGGVFSVSLPTSANAANAGMVCVLGAGTNITLDGGTFQSTTAATVSFNRLFTLGVNGGTIDTGSSGVLSINNQISGPGSLTKVGAKQLILGGITTGALSPLASNIFAGNLFINQGEVQIRNSYAIGAGKAVVANGSDLAVGGGANYGSIFGNIDLNGGDGVGGNFAGTLQVNDANTQANFVGTINLLSSSSVGTINNGNVVTFTISGPIIGPGALKKLGTNTVTLTSANSYGGGTLVSSGTLQLGNGGVCGTTGSGAVTNNAQLTFNHNDNTTNSSGISGTGSLTQKGTGTLVLAGSNPYTGTTTVSAGTLLVNGSLGTNTVTVANAATLGGTGSIGGAVTVQNGGTLAIGATVGTLTMSKTLTLSATSTNFMKLNKTGTALSNDSIAGLSAITFNGRLNVTASGDALAGGDTFQLFSASSYSGAFASTNLPALGANLAWDTSNLGTGTLKVLSTGPSQPQITSSSRLADGTFHLTFSGTSGFGYRVWATTNVALKPVTSTWTQLTSGTFGAGPVSFTDTQATNFTQRFYDITTP